MNEHEKNPDEFFRAETPDPSMSSHLTGATRHQKFISGARLSPEKDTLPDPLPMTVWLRGDESYCQDFSLEADAVMAQLGIKRTRLTQISGRELRVGRIKRSRYIVPVYRPEDVANYLNWSRPTATHLKSTLAVQSATLEFKDTASSILEEINSILGREFKNSQNHITNLLEQLVSSEVAKAHHITKLHQGLTSYLDWELLRLTQKIDEQEAKRALFTANKLPSLADDLKNALILLVRQEMQHLKIAIESEWDLHKTHIHQAFDVFIESQQTLRAEFQQLSLAVTNALREKNDAMKKASFRCKATTHPSGSAKRQIQRRGACQSTSSRQWSVTKVSVPKNRLLRKT